MDSASTAGAARRGSHAITDRSHDPRPGVAAVRGLLHRHLGDRAHDIELSISPAKARTNGELDSPTRSRHTYQVRGGRLSVDATDPIALAAGIQRYAKDECGSSATWDDVVWLDLPERLRDTGPVTHTTALVHRYYLNVVTSGYSTAYWDGDRWEREIDWMALHGITMPLMTLGHEAVLLATYLELGLDRDEILAWMGSAAHLPWTWMGGTHDWGGPLPEEWIDRHLQIAQQVLERQRELGMTPVLPGFAGHIPAVLAPEDVATIDWQGWISPVLDASSPLFQKVADVFYRTQLALLGGDHYYAVDPYIESVPPTEEPSDLRSTAKGIFTAMRAADPDAIWVLQGWPFHYQSEFWTRPRVEAFLEPIPQENLLVLDLWADYAPMWQSTDAVWGRQWLWCMVHNFGGRPAVFGDLAGIHDDLLEAQRSSARGNLTGFGLAMEAIENNAVVYELATDLVWSPASVLESWLRRFAAQRYGVDSDEAHRAWSILLTTLYGPGRSRAIPSPIVARPWSSRLPFAAQRLAGEQLPDAARPSANIDAENDPAVLGDLAAIADAVDALLGLAHGTIRGQEALRRDVAELVGHIIAQHSRLAIREILSSYERADAQGISAAADRLVGAIEDLDALARTRSETLVGTWIASARRWGGSRDDADVLELDARTLITVWGTQDSGLHDYSARHWSGLLTDYYAARWQAWAAWLRDAVVERVAPDDSVLHRRIVDIEEGWRRSRAPYPAEPSGDTFALAQRCLDQLRPDLERLRQSPVTPTTT